MVKFKRLLRPKRDENEMVRSAFGRGVGFYIGEPCESTCNRILFHVYCNKTTGKCECLEQYPVNIGNKACVKAARLGEPCEYDDACAFFDSNTVCPEGDGKCACSDGYRPPGNSNHEGPAYCLPAWTLPIGSATGSGTVKLLEQSNLLTLASVIGGLIVFTGLFCFVLRLFSKARFNRPADRMANAGSPPPPIIPTFGGGHILDSRRASRSSESTDYLPGLSSRRASYSMLAPPSSMGSRRASSTSIRSQFSFRTNSSFRGYRYTRDPARRTLSSPADSQYPPSPCKAANHHPHHHHHHSNHHHHQHHVINHHPLHHNSPVDDDINEDSPVPGEMNMDQLSNHM